MPQNETSPLDPLYDRKAKQEAKAYAKVDDSFPLKSANELKQFVVNQARAIQSRPLTEKEREAALETLIQEARSRLDEYEEKVRKRYGQKARIGDDAPVTDEEHKRYQRIISRLALEDTPDDRAEVLRDAMTSAAKQNQLGLVNELEELVNREISKSRFGEVPEGHPLDDARLAADLARQNTQTIQVERAEEYLANVTQELSAVIETVAERGEWSGPRVRATGTRRSPSGHQVKTGPGNRWLDPAGPEEIRHAESVGMDETESRLEDLASDLPSMDPILSDAAREASRPEPAEPEEDPRDRFELGDGRKVKDALQEDQD